MNLILPAFVAEAVPNGGSGSLKDDESWLERLCRVPRSLQIHLATVWAMSHFVFASCMFATLWVLFLFLTASLISSHSAKLYAQRMGVYTHHLYHRIFMGYNAMGSFLSGI